jgi:hypothetical protein
MAAAVEIILRGNKCCRGFAAGTPACFTAACDTTDIVKKKRIATTAREEFQTALLPINDTSSSS